MTVVKLQSPLRGWATALSDVPDPAFAQGLVGDGLAVDPFESDLCAPCDGMVVALHRAMHACTVRAENGAEILMHIGVDTVEMGGDGFVAHVSEGQVVRAGDKLITFDMDKVARQARSVQVIIVVANGSGFPVKDRVLNCEVMASDYVMSVDGGDALPVVREQAPHKPQETASQSVQLKIAGGLHARPAARLATAAREFSGTVTIKCGAARADAKSIVALMGMSTRLGDMLEICADGAGAADVVATLVDAVEAGLGDPVVEDLSAVRSPEDMTGSLAQAVPLLSGHEEVVFAEGTTAVAGLAVGPAVRLFHDAPVYAQTGQGVAQEKARFALAFAGLTERLVRAGKGESSAAEIFRAHSALLREPDLERGTLELIEAGKSAEAAWVETLSKLVDVLRGAKDARMVERVADLKDIQAQLLGILTGKDLHAVLAAFPEGGVLIADEVFPSELTAIPSGKLAGICMAAGGKTSHAVILAEAMSIPVLVAAGPEIAGVPDKAPVIIDGANGTLRVFSSAQTQADMRAAAAIRAEQHEMNRQTAHEICYTADGARIEVFANLGKVDDATVAMAEGAEGCGLLRSEFLYLGRATAPSEDEQLQQYQAIADALEGRPLIIRTLDAGGDKPLAYFRIPAEENPALGVRGVRATLRNEELLRTQLRAILRVQPYGIAKIMVPMITGVDELRKVKAIIDEERVALGRQEAIEVGTMIEVPAAAMTTAQLAQEAAFFSIGTNDLTQYGLAMDRGNPALAPSIDALHPGVLRLIEQVAIGAAPRKRTVAVCGGAASDLTAVPVLIGLGVSELSASAAVIADVKALIRTLSLADCKALAQSALTAETSEDVRHLVSGYEV